MRYYYHRHHLLHGEVLLDRMQNRDEISTENSLQCNHPFCYYSVAASVVTTSSSPTSVLECLCPECNIICVVNGNWEEMDMFGDPDALQQT